MPVYTSLLKVRNFVPIIMYGLRLFIVVLTRTTHVCLLKTTCILSFILMGHCISESHAKLCFYHNVWPEVVLQELHADIVGVTDFHSTKFPLLILSVFRYVS